MDRREVLKGLPLLVGISGCVDAPNGSDAAPASETTNRTNEGSPSALNVTLRSSYRYAHSDDGIGIKTPEYDQFAFITLPHSTPAPAPQDVTLTLDTDQFSRLTTAPGPAMTPGIDSVYTTEDRPGALMFDLPTVETETALLEYDDKSVPLDDQSCARLAKSPAMSLEALTVPERVPPNDTLSVEITVTNDGDRSGLYLAGARIGGYPQLLNVAVSPDNTATDAVTYETPPEPTTLHLTVSSPAGERDIEVAVETSSDG